MMPVVGLQPPTRMPLQMMTDLMPILYQSIDNEHKKQVDAGSPMSAEKRAAYKMKRGAAKRRRIETTSQELYEPALGGEPAMCGWCSGT